jgi:hypothetical protein
VAILVLLRFTTQARALNLTVLHQGDKRRAFAWQGCASSMRMPVRLLIETPEVIHRSEHISTAIYTIYQIPSVPVVMHERYRSVSVRGVGQPTSLHAQSAEDVKEGAGLETDRRGHLANKRKLSILFSPLGPTQSILPLYVLRMMKHLLSSPRDKSL